MIHFYASVMIGGIRMNVYLVTTGLTVQMFIAFVTIYNHMSFSSLETNDCTITKIE